MNMFLAWLHHTAQYNCLHPVLFAFDSYLILNRIHPFVDCNGRVTRVLMNLFLLHYHYPPLFFWLDRDLYHQTVAATRLAFLGNRRPFYKFFLEHLAHAGESTFRCSATDF
jgi:Fic family protein